MDSPSDKFVPRNPTLPKLIKASKGCTACDLYKNATQTVFGEGSSKAEIFFIGEQPGDKEDQEGKPFVGPAGKLLDRALERAKIDRKKVYVTNTVKHFKFRREGKRRLHERPNGVEIKACRGWLNAELSVIAPKFIVCLGATAAQSLLGRSFRVTANRGKIFPTELPLKDTILSTKILTTIHPSALLRLPKNADREREFESFVQDLAILGD
jgi:uracil-DNA glycosylase family protein